MASKVFVFMKVYFKASIVSSFDTQSFFKIDSALVTVTSGGFTSTSTLLTLSPSVMIAHR